MYLKRIAIVLVLAAALAACSPSNNSVQPTNAPAQNTAIESPEPPVQATVVATPAAPVPAATVPSSIADLDPSHLDAGDFDVELINPNGTRHLEPLAPQDENSEYVYADYTPPSDFAPDINVTFNWNRRVREATYNSKIILQLPPDVQPGTYPIEGSALMGETGIVGAYVDHFSNEAAQYAFYDQFEGTVTVTAIDALTVSGSFAFMARSDEGQVSNVSGVFNQIAAFDGISMNWDTKM